MADFYAARSRIIPPLPWPTIAPPFSVLEPNCGIDTSYYADDWHGVSPRVEIVTADFVEARKRREPAPAAQDELFDEREFEPAMGM